MAVEKSVVRSVLRCTVLLFNTPFLKPNDSRWVTLRSWIMSVSRSIVMRSMCSAMLKMGHVSFRCTAHNAIFCVWVADYTLSKKQAFIHRQKVKRCSSPLKWSSFRVALQWYQSTLHRHTCILFHSFPRLKRGVVHQFAASDSGRFSFTTIVDRDTTNSGRSQKFSFFWKTFLCHLSPAPPPQKKQTSTEAWTVKILFCRFRIFVAKTKNWHGKTHIMAPNSHEGKRYSTKTSRHFPSDGTSREESRKKICRHREECAERPRVNIIRLFAKQSRGIGPLFAFFCTDAEMKADESSVWNRQGAVRGMSPAGLKSKVILTWGALEAYLIATRAGDHFDVSKKNGSERLIIGRTIINGPAFAGKSKTIKKHIYGFLGKFRGLCSCYTDFLKANFRDMNR